MFLSYVSHSEYPLCASACGRGLSEKPLRRDPEKDVKGDVLGNRGKLYAISSELNGNRSIAGTTGLLPPPPPPVHRNANGHLADESETLSVSTVEEQSMDTFSTEISFRAPHVPTQTKVQSTNNRQPKSQRSAGSNTVSSSGSSYRSRKLSRAYSGTVPDRGVCLLAMNTGEYILPSTHPHTSLSERSTIASDSSTSAASSNSRTYNYLPINDHDEIQKKISHDLDILLPKNVNRA